MITVTSDTDLAEAFRNVRDGETIQIGPGNYHVNPPEPIDIANQAFHGAALPLFQRVGVTIQGVGDPTIFASTHGNLIGLIDCHRVRVRGIRLSGPGYLSEYKPYYFAALYLGGNNQELVFEDLVIEKFGDHGIGHLLNGATSNSAFQRLVFRVGGCLRTPDGLGDGAAIAVGGYDNTFENVFVEDWLRGIEWETKYTDHPTKGNIARNCRFQRCMWEAITVMATHGKADLFYGNHIVDCVIEGRNQPFDDHWRSEHGISIHGGTDFSIRGGTVRGLHNWIGVSVAELDADISDFVVDGVRIYGPNMRTGVHIEPSSGFKIRRGLVVNNQIGPLGDGRGIFIDGEDISVSNNQVRECGRPEKRWEGIYKAPGAAKVAILNNSVSGTADVI
jgi:hypothetical protein